MEKKAEKRAQKKIGYKEGKSWNMKREKGLMKITTRGVVKLFNSIYDYKKKLVEKEEVDSIINL